MREQVLPKLRLDMFFCDAEVVAEMEAAFAQSEKQPPPPDLLHKYLHFSPLRSGNRIMVSLDLEQYAPPLRSEYGIDQEFIEKQKSVWLEWNKEEAIFKLTAPLHSLRRRRNGQSSIT